MPKTVDYKCYEFSKQWLLSDGYTFTGDIQKLAEIVQDISEEFKNELDQACENEKETPR